MLNETTTDYRLHYTAHSGLRIDATIARTITPGLSYTLEVTLKGTSASVSVNGQPAVGFAYNAATVDGSFGTFADRAPASFDSFSITTNDRAFPGP